ncbi:hypothetical protein B0H13DRAFT_2319552 [Mycena leptocephala]|nr:hypothetical protein B0H13DRAFT_2319552 [Mycena leptocephala]
MNPATQSDRRPDPRSGLWPASAYVFVAPKDYASPMHMSQHYYYMLQYSLACLFPLLLPHILRVRSSLPVTYIRPPFFSKAHTSAIRYRPSSNAACVRGLLLSAGVVVVLYLSLLSSFSHLLHIYTRPCPRPPALRLVILPLPHAPALSPSPSLSLPTPECSLADYTC